jgi:hypothetical protein
MPETPSWSAPVPASAEAKDDTDTWEVAPAPAAADTPAWQQTASSAPAPTPAWQQPPAPPPAQPPSYQPPAYQQYPQQPGYQQPQQYQQPTQYQQPYQGQQYQQPYGQPQYQQPYGQPGPYGQPYNAAYAQPAQAGRYGNSVAAVLGGVLLFVLGIGVALLGFIALNSGPDIARFIRDNEIVVNGVKLTPDLLRSVLTPSPGILMVLGIIQAIAGFGVMAHKSWGRWLGFLLALLGLVVAVVATSVGYALARGFTVPVILAVVAVIGYIVILIALLAGGSHFRRRAPGA